MRVDPVNSYCPNRNIMHYPLCLLKNSAQSASYYYALNNSVNFLDTKGLYVGAIGLGASGAISGEISPGFFGAFSILYVNDDKGNEGIVVCVGGGLAGGSGGVAGLQTSHLWGVDSICDLVKSGFSLSYGVGGGAGPGIAADLSKTGLNVITGVGFGGYSGAENVFSKCRLLVTKYKCKSKCETK